MCYFYFPLIYSRILNFPWAVCAVVLYKFRQWYFSLLDPVIRYFFCIMFTAISSYPESERAPLLRNYLQSLQRLDDYTESTGNFYSPVDSPQSMFMTELYVLLMHYLFWSFFIMPSFGHNWIKWNPVHNITVIFLKYCFDIVSPFMICLLRFPP
jgi:hypothetical protein